MADSIVNAIKGAISGTVDALKNGSISNTIDALKSNSISDDQKAYQQELQNKFQPMHPESAQAQIAGTVYPVEPGQIYMPIGNEAISIGPQSVQMPEQPAELETEMPVQSAQSAQPVQPMQPMQQMPSPNQNYIAETSNLIGKQKAANNALTLAAKTKADFEVKKNKEMADQYEKDLLSHQQRTKERADLVDRQMQFMDEAQQSYKGFLASPEAKVNPNKMWETASTGQKILAGISLALGAIGAGNTGKNGAVEIITNAINRDVEAQKININLQAEGKLKDYDMERNVYAQMLQKFSNEDQAEAATRMLRLQQVQSQLNEVASKYTGTQVQQQAKLANLALDQAMAQQKQQFAMAAQQQALLNQVGQNDPMSLSMAQLAALPKEIREQVAEVRERYVPGYGPAINKQSAAEFQKVRAGAEPVMNAVNRVITLLKDLNRVTDFMSPRKGAIESELKALAGSLRLPITGPGALTDDEYKRLRDTIGNPTKLLAFPSIELAKMMQIDKKIKDDLDAAAEQYGLPRKNRNIQLKSQAPAK